MPSGVRMMNQFAADFAFLSLRVRRLFRSKPARVFRMKSFASRQPTQRTGVSYAYPHGLCCFARNDNRRWSCNEGENSNDGAIGHAGLFRLDEGMGGRGDGVPLFVSCTLKNSGFWKSKGFDQQHHGGEDFRALLVGCRAVRIRIGGVDRHCVFNPRLEQTL